MAPWNNSRCRSWSVARYPDQLAPARPGAALTNQPPPPGGPARAGVYLALIHGSHPRMHQETRRLLELWRSKCTRQDVPDRRDFMPEEFGPWMGRPAICEVEPEPQRFRLRLVGTEICDLDGRDYTGWYLDDAIKGEPFRRHILGQWALCAAKRRPVLVTYSSRPEASVVLSLEKLFLPLSTGSDAVGQVLAYVRVTRAGCLLPRWPTLQELERDGGSFIIVIG